jgi:hypothetical protein
MMKQNEVIENTTQKRRRRRNKKMTPAVAVQQVSFLMTWARKCSDVPGVD